jgi:hypothetical protein
MTFTYVGTLTTSLDIIRFKLGDTVEDSGVKPNGGNFTDEEIAGLLSLEDDNTGRTVAALCEVLANIWANYVDTRIGPRDEKLSQIPKFWQTRAKQLRSEVGYTTGSVSTGTINLGIDEEDENFNIT